MEAQIPELFMKAITFAAAKHKNQFRKGSDQCPYINHPLYVTSILVKVGVLDLNLLIAALLHDTVEDTKTSPEEIENEFNTEIKNLVLEVTDDKSLSKEKRKLLQVENTPHKSDGAKLLKIADKISNLEDIASHPPVFWTKLRKMEYIKWATDVVAGCRGINPKLEHLFDETVLKTKAKISGQI